MTVQKIKHDDSLPRVETGAVQFGDDWPGLFIRGDNAAHLMMSIQAVCEWVKRQPDWGEIAFDVIALQSYAMDIGEDVIVKSECQHEWVDARNEVVKSGHLCTKCGAIKK